MKGCTDPYRCQDCPAMIASSAGRFLRKRCAACAERHRKQARRERDARNLAARHRYERERRQAAVRSGKCGRCRKGVPEAGLHTCRACIAEVKAYQLDAMAAE